MTSEQRAAGSGQQVLITQACQGDAGAWEILVDQQQEAVFRLAYLLLRDADEAQDVAQDAFIRAFRALHRFDPARPLRPWLLSITANLARNRRRAMGRYWAALQRLFWTSPELATSTPGEPASSGGGQALWKAVQRLNQTDQEIIYLRYFLELSVAETAEAVGIAPGTVKSRLSRALERLRGIVERDFPALREEVNV